MYSAYKLNKQGDNIQPYTDDTTLMAENKEELKSLLMKVKEESEKADLKLNIENKKKLSSVLLNAITGTFVMVSSSLWEGKEKSEE